MFDTRPALADMAGQIRNCRDIDGLTLQQLAARSGVAASTIHKVESQQMVPTVSVLLKIAKGLGRKPEDLIRDEVEIVETPTSQLGRQHGGQRGNRRGRPHRKSARAALTRRDTTQRAGIWRIELSNERPFPKVGLDINQRAIVLVERGDLDIQAGERRIQMRPGDCIEVEGGRTIEACGRQSTSASVTLIVTPPGELEIRLGAPTALQHATP